MKIPPPQPPSDGSFPCGTRAPTASPAGASPSASVHRSRARESRPPTVSRPSTGEQRISSSPSYARFLSAAPSSPSSGSDSTKSPESPRCRAHHPPWFPAGPLGSRDHSCRRRGGGPCDPTGVVRNPGPAGGRGQSWSGRGRCGGRGRAPPCGAAHPCPSSPGGQPAGPGAPALCHRPCTPRAGAGVSGRPCGAGPRSWGLGEGGHPPAAAGGGMGRH